MPLEDGRHTIALVGGAGGIASHLTSFLKDKSKDIGRVVILDIPTAQGVAYAKEIDLADTYDAFGVDIEIVHTSDYEEIKGAEYVVHTAGFPRKPGAPRESLITTNVPITETVAKGIKKYAPNAQVFVIANPLDATVHVTQEIIGNPNQVIGMAGVLDSSRLERRIKDRLNLNSHITTLIEEFTTPETQKNIKTKLGLDKDQPFNVVTISKQLREQYPNIAECNLVSKLLHDLKIIPKHSYRGNSPFKTSDVKAYTLGGHGDTMVPVISKATVKERPLTEQMILSQKDIEDIIQSTRDAGGQVVTLNNGRGSATQSPAASVFKMLSSYIDARKGIQQDPLPMTVQVKDKQGVTGGPLYIGVLATFTPNGGYEVQEVELSAKEAQQFEATIAANRKLIENTKKFQNFRDRVDAFINTVRTAPQNFYHSVVTTLLKWGDQELANSDDFRSRFDESRLSTYKGDSVRDKLATCCEQSHLSDQEKKDVLKSYDTAVSPNTQIRHHRTASVAGVASVAGAAM